MFPQYIRELRDKADVGYGVFAVCSLRVFTFGRCVAVASVSRGDLITGEFTEISGHSVTALSPVFSTLCVSL